MHNGVSTNSKKSFERAHGECLQRGMEGLQGGVNRDRGRFARVPQVRGARFSESCMIHSVLCVSVFFGKGVAQNVWLVVDSFPAALVVWSFGRLVP